MSGKLKLHDSYRLSGASEPTATLVMMLAGYKPELWPFVFPRFEAALPEHCTVCIVSPGRDVTELASLCHDKRWSYLATSTNDVALAQNVCLTLHPQAQMIVKLDEDMFLLPGGIGGLLDCHARIRSEHVIDPGFVAPMIPVNGFAYRTLLERLDLLQEFEWHFGPARIATTGTPVTTDPAAARWMWERTAPIAETQTRLAASPAEMLTSPIKFSIGMIAYDRAFWEEIRYFPVHRARLLAGQSTLGGDEEFLCKECVDRSRPIVVAPNLVAGHFSFGSQYQGMLELLRERPEIFRG